MIYDIIHLPNSNQAVIVDKTQIPNDHEGYWVYFNDDGTLDGDPCPCNQPPGWFAKLHDIKNYAVVLASREPIPGVYLLPEWLWDKRLIAFNNAFKGEPMDPNEYFLAKRNFNRGYESAGWYTREDMWRAYNAGMSTSANDSTGSVFLDGKAQIRFNADMKVIDKLKETHPRQLDITLNEDGSLPVDEKGVVKVNNVIY